MEDNFFLRFCLQRSCSTFKENEYDCRKIINKTDSEIDEFLKNCADEQSESANEIKEQFGGKIKKLYSKKILFIGDSVTQDIRGYRGIVTKAAELCAHSIAFSGATSTDMVRKTFDAVESTKPDIVSVMIGTNDVFFLDKEKKINLVSCEEYARNIGCILKFAANSGAKIVVGTIPPMDKEKAAKYKSIDTKYNSNENIEHYNRILLKEIEKIGATVIDTYTPIIGNTKYFEPDGVHISPVGHTLLAKKWIDALLKAVEV